MDNIPEIGANFIEQNCDFSELISLIKQGFSENSIIVPKRHHHDYNNPSAHKDSTLLLMPAFQPGKNAGVKMITINPDNNQFDLPAIQGTYILYNAKSGLLKAIIEAKSLTTKRTAATSALASSFLSKKNARSLLMIGTGALSVNLIKAHCAVRPITNVYVWGRNIEKAQKICAQLSNERFSIVATQYITDKISEVDIISCATLSKTPLVLGEYLSEGQHIDLVGAYKPDMREADDATILKSSIFIDTYDGLGESGDMVIPISNGILNKNSIKADLFELCSHKKSGRSSNDEITVFKSVGHALEDLVAANYFYNKFENA